MSATDTIDVAALVEMVLGRIGSTYDNEAHLSGEEARQLAAALQSQADALAEARRQWKYLSGLAEEQHNIDVAEREAAEASLATMREALEWYEVQVRNCRKLGNDGHEARAALDRDGGDCARRALGGSNAE